MHTSFVFDGLNIELPMAIEPGKAYEIFVPDENIDEMLAHAITKEIKASAQDALWRNSYSNILVHRE